MHGGLRTRVYKIENTTARGLDSGVTRVLGLVVRRRQWIGLGEQLIRYDFGANGTAGQDAGWTKIELERPQRKHAERAWKAGV